MGQLEIVILFTDSRLLKKRRANHLFCLDLAVSLFKVSVKENEVPTEKILLARVFSLQTQVIYQIKAKRLNYLTNDFILSNFKKGCEEISSHPFLGLLSVNQMQ